MKAKMAALYGQRPYFNGMYKIDRVIVILTRWRCSQLVAVDLLIKIGKNCEYLLFSGIPYSIIHLQIKSKQISFKLR